MDHLVQARNCQKLLSGFDLQLMSIKDTEKIITSLDESTLLQQHELVSEFFRFFAESDAAEALRELKAHGISSKLTKRASILLSSIVSGLSRPLTSVQIPVEQTRFLFDFLRDLFDHQPDLRTQLAELYGPYPFTVRGLAFSEIARAVKDGKLVKFSSVELAALRSLQTYPGDTELAEIVQDDLLDFLKLYLLGHESQASALHQPLVTFIPNWIVMRDTENIPYDPKVCWSVYASLL